MPVLQDMPQCQMQPSVCKKNSNLLHRKGRHRWYQQENEPSTAPAMLGRQVTADTEVLTHATTGPLPQGPLPYGCRSKAHSNAMPYWCLPASSSCSSRGVPHVAASPMCRWAAGASVPDQARELGSSSASTTCHKSTGGQPPPGALKPPGGLPPHAQHLLPSPPT
jgi:hypothetical protein